MNARRHKPKNSGNSEAKMSESEKNQGRKRSRHRSRASHHHQQRGGGRGGRGGNRNKNPRRGGPGVILTCEGARERKCRTEGLDILRHYYYASLEQSEDGSDIDKTKDGEVGKAKSDGPGIVSVPSASTDSRKLTMEEEIALLKGGASADDVLRGSKDDGGSERKCPFSEYETGCKGTVFIMCTLPNCNLIPVPRSEMAEHMMSNKPKKEASSTSGNSDDSDDVEGRAQPKKRRVEEREEEEKKTQETPATPETPPWDPIVTVRQILDDLSQKNALAASKAPESRFVTRMIPIQATCFASLEDIKSLGRSLLSRYMFREIVAEKKNKATFGIAFKRRNCAHLKRDSVIEAVANVIEDLRNACTVSGDDGGCGDKQKIPELSVDLTSPDYSIQIEVCKTLCGMSVVPAIASFDNFNLFTKRQLNEEDES